MPHVLERTQVIPSSLEEVFPFFADPGNLARITPPWLRFMHTDRGPLTMEEGLRLHYTIRPFPLVRQRWTSLISVWDPPHAFVDEQVRGPYRAWRHLHTFRAVDGGTEIGDRVEYALPLGPLGKVVHAAVVRRQLESIFDYRERAVRRILG